MRRSLRLTNKTTDLPDNMVSQGVSPKAESFKIVIKQEKWTPSFDTDKITAGLSETQSDSTSNVCNVCYEAYRSQKSLAIHMTRFHKKQLDAKSQECRETVSSKAALSNHQGPISEWPTQCPFCFQRLQAISDLRDHFASSAHQNDPRIPKYLSEGWIELLETCPPPPAGSKPVDSDLPKTSLASKPKKRSSRREISTPTLAKKVRRGSDVQTREQKATSEKNLQLNGKQDDDLSVIDPKASLQSSPIFPEKIEQPMPSDATDDQPLVHSSQHDLFLETFLFEHSYSLRTDTVEEPYPQDKILATLSFLHNYASKRKLPKILPKAHPEASPTIPKPQAADQTTTSPNPPYKVVKILGQNSTVIKQLLVPRDARICLVQKPKKRIVYPTLYNLPVEKKTVSKVLSNKPIFPAFPKIVEKTAFLSNEVINPLTL